MPSHRCTLLRSNSIAPYGVGRVRRVRCTRRDLEDVFSSLVRVGGVPSVLVPLAGVSRVSSLSCLCISRETLERFL